MITKVVHGWRVGGLVAYLMGPGRAQEHVNPRVIASWDGRDSSWQPQQTGPTEFDRELGPLIRALRAPAVAANLPEQDRDGKRGYVWHCSARVAAGDRVLTDTEWAEIARELLAGSGIASSDDVGGPRWVAIRHADDHIHIAVVLVRQDTCRRFWPSRDYPRLREAAQRIERRLGLTLTASADGTAERAPGRGEIEKARRQGREPARHELARAVRAAAVAAVDVDGFVDELRSVGYLVEIRCAPSGDPLGYKVARATDVSAWGAPVFYSGSKLAPDLSLPRLQQGWAEAERGSVAGDPVRAARRRVLAARGAVAAARRGHVVPDEGVEDVVHAANDVLTALAGSSAGLATGSEQFARASRPPRGTRPAPGPRAAGLRRIARQLVRSRRMPGASDDSTTAAVALVVALSALTREVAAWQRERGRAHQAAAAVAAARSLDRWAADRAAGGSPDGQLALDYGSTTGRPRIDRAALGPSDAPRG
ncbi:relaxase/mobilization nuclease domain-containing protein [Pseudonocardia hydrocarbonoxydans]|uniref:relaxase/mobilization nuclease domain-containing protein n=1 Tax=Pseudonocardia hydrocarbonoxydans TaxID=76726 RepID=UPI0031DA689F